jgi:magnesium chelatase family protein
MTLPEALETTRLHSVAGLTGDRTALVTARPFRALHHTISDVGLIGGGQVLMPGEDSLAHHGPLCLDAQTERRPSGERIMAKSLTHGSGDLCMRVNAWATPPRPFRLADRPWHLGFLVKRLPFLHRLMTQASHLLA